VRGLQVAHVAEREGAGESVESALRYKPLRGGRRALLLFEVDRMTADAQAALLKTTEEPPPATHFLLTAADPTPILPALLSRCRIARVAAPPQEELLRRAAALGIEDQEFLILSQAMGRAEAALDLESEARSHLLSAHRDFQSWLSEPGIAPHWAAPHDGSLAEQREYARLSLSACLGWLSSVYLSSSAEQALRLDRLAELLTSALAEIGNQITPSLVLEQLAEEVRETVAPR